MSELVPIYGCSHDWEGDPCPGIDECERPKNWYIGGGYFVEEHEGLNREIYDPAFAREIDVVMAIKYLAKQGITTLEAIAQLPQEEIDRLVAEAMPW